MWATVWFALTLAIIYYSYWINKWRNPKCNGSLPPGSMGLPLIGETLQLLIPSYSLDLHPFIKKRIQRYGLIFRSNVAGRPIIISADPEFNRYIINQEGNLVEMWYLDTFSKLFSQDGEIRTNAIGLAHKYARSLFLNHFGSESLKEKLLPEMEKTINRTLCQWSNHAPVEVKHAASLMALNFTAKQAFGYDLSLNISKSFTGFLKGFMSFPLNLPGTAYHKCMEEQKKMMDFLRQELEERLASPNKHYKDVLGQAVDDLKKEKFLTPEFIVKMLFGVLFASFESISAVMTLAFKLLSEHPLVLQELVAENDRILKNRKDRHSTSSLTWDEYKSLTFTHQVINEVLRMGNVAPGLLRRAMKDFEYKGYTIPGGWPIMVVTSARHMNPDVYEDPLVFNPWRWKKLDSYTISCNFTPFGGGIRQCAGAEYSKAFLATFFHVLVTKFTWTNIKGGEIARSPILGFGDGVRIKVCERH
ncbi:hypothetical protein K2173_010608 [Erythroxylum novogranatense]|uniref:Cytochrome P450 87A3 n=1 Tax=Erythroxylum novogranatense TaxID=1862640 RepID=A0AAV8TEC4_9ROSI|nr:hypothetical protein K2173_010608 [Erythroxylum novogranatense]